MFAAAALGGQQHGDGLRRKRVGGDPVDGVRGKDHALLLEDGPLGMSQSGGALSSAVQL